MYKSHFAIVLNYSDATIVKATQGMVKILKNLCFIILNNNCLQALHHITGKP